MAAVIAACRSVSVELVLGVEDQRDVQHTRHRFGGLVSLPVGQQIQQVFCETQVRTRLDLPLGMGEAIRSSDEDGDLSQQPN